LACHRGRPPQAFWVRLLEFSLTVGIEPVRCGFAPRASAEQREGLKNPAAPLRYAAA